MVRRHPLDKRDRTPSLRAFAEWGLKREAVRVLDRFHREIHIHVRPVEMALLGPLDIEDRVNGRPFEPRKLFKRSEELSVSQEDPKAMTRAVGALSL